MMVHNKHAWEFQVWSCCCCGCCRGQPCIHQVSVTTWFMIHMTYDLDHIVRTICCVLLFLGDWQFSRNVLNFSHSVANNNISREMITLVHNAVRYIYTHLVQLLWGNFHYIDGTIITIYSSAPLTQSDYHFINQIILPSPVTYLSHCTLCQILRTTPSQIQDRCSLWGRAK